MLRLQHQAVFEPTLPVEEAAQHLAPFAAVHLDQESKASHVDAEDWHAAGRAEMAGAQHGAVAAEGDQEVELTGPHPGLERFVVD